MAISDVYDVRSSNTLNTASQTLILGLTAATTKRAFIVGVRMEITASSASAGSSALFQLARPGNSASTASGSATATPTAQDAFSASAFSSGWTAITGMTTSPTFGNVLAEWTIPQTTGSAWEEFPPLGYEWVVPQNANGTAQSTNGGVGIWLWVTGASGSTTYVADFIFSE